MDSFEKGKIDEKVVDDFLTDSDSEASFFCKVCKKSFSGYKPLVQHERSAKHHKKLLKSKRTNELIDELSDEDASTFPTEPLNICEVCNKQFHSEDSYQQHIKSKPHRKKLILFQKFEEAKVDGNLDIDKLTNSHEKHFSTELSQGGEIRSEATVILSSVEDSPNSLECVECGKAFSGPEPFYIHITSKTHKKVIKKNALLKNLITQSQKVLSEDLPELPTSPETDSNYLTTIGNISDIIVCKMCHMSFSGPESAASHLKGRNHAKKLELKKWKADRSRAENSGNTDDFKDQQTDAGDDGVLKPEQDKKSIDDNNEALCTKEDSILNPTDDEFINKNQNVPSETSV